MDTTQKLYLRGMTGEIYTGTAWEALPAAERGCVGGRFLLAARRRVQRAHFCVRRGGARRRYPGGGHDRGKPLGLPGASLSPVCAVRMGGAGRFAHRRCVRSGHGRGNASYIPRQRAGLVHRAVRALRAPARGGRRRSSNWKRTTARMPKRTISRCRTRRRRPSAARSISLRRSARSRRSRTSSCKRLRAV